MAGEVKVERVDPETRGRGRRTQLDVVYIHGLGGDSKDTWRASRTEYWPQRVADANPHAQVWVVDYPAKPGQLLTLGETDQPGTAGLSVLITAKLRTKGIGEKPCVFVCHSLGGLVTKRILLDAWVVPPADKTRFKHENIKAVMFCGTPHRGSAIASVLKGAEWVKGVALRNLLPYVGWLGDKVGEKAGELAASSVLTTSDLITELEKNNVGLQHLNEDFGGYYGERVKSGFMVKVYAETEKLKVKGVPTAMVVSAESANPNLRIGPNAPLQVLPVPDKDHSELVKPTRDDDYVVEGLNDLIRRVGERSYDFDLCDGVHQRVAMLLHAEFVRWKGLVMLPCFSALRQSGATEEDACFQVTRQMAELSGQAVIEQLRKLKRGFSEIPADAGLRKELHSGLTRIGCTLLVTYMAVEAAAAEAGEGVIALEVPVLDDPEDLDVMVEVLHATVRGWPVGLQISSAIDKKLTSSNRVLRAAGQAPLSWRADDHVQHLAERILADRPFTPQELAQGKGGSWQPLTDGDTLPAHSNQVQQRRVGLAKLLLEEWLADNFGLVINAQEPSSPYAGVEMRERLTRAFGNGLALVDPHPNPADNQTLNKLDAVKIAAQQFLLTAESTRT